MNLTVSASPHIRGKDTTARLMLDVVIALLPALAAGVIFHGPRAALVAADEVPRLGFGGILKRFLNTLFLQEA